MRGGGERRPSRVPTLSSDERPSRPDDTFRTLSRLWPYMWPADRPDLRLRVILALSTLVGAKIVTVLIPYTYKWTTDALTLPGRLPASAPESLALWLSVPVLLAVAYGVARV